VAFAIGTETRGSIVSPATRCGVTGLRPTFGRVSRHGAMALAWSMDKIGPLCRSVEDCALVLATIQGPDGHDRTVKDVPFNWDATIRPTDLRVGYLKSAFDTEVNHPTKPFDDAALEVIRRLGVRPTPIELPTQYPVPALGGILSAEAAAAFDDITRDKRVNLMERSSWPNTFRHSRLIPAVEYIRANRIRTMLMQATHDALRSVDVVVTPTNAPNLTALTNLTGQPVVVLPSGFREDGTPVSLSFLGNLFGEAEALVLAKAYQDATDFHLKRPARFV
jgi:Asp-tRNA(Asn)/Glu-tRNA(Gln) amidotransferase A subunit family amidase